jgi:hypothetical protein
MFLKYFSKPQFRNVLYNTQDNPVNYTILSADAYICTYIFKFKVVIAAHFSETCYY